MLTSIYSWTLFNCFSLPLKLDLILVNLVFAQMTTARRADFSELTLSGVFGFTVVVKLELRSDCGENRLASSSVVFQLWSVW